MLKSLPMKIILLILFFSVSAYANDYFPHISVNARTLTPGKISLQNSPGLGATTNILLSSLSVGIYPRVEIGSIPLFYFVDNHRLNYNVKVNIYDSNIFRSSLGVSRIEFRFEDSELLDKYKYILNYYSWAANYIFPNSVYSLGLTLNYASSHLTSTYFTETFDNNYEWSFDVIKKLNDTTIVSAGIGEHQDEITYKSTAKNFGSGISLTKIRPKKMFSSPRIGAHYLNKSKDFMYLITTSIY